MLGKQSQLGPIDPQLVFANKQHSARAIVEGFDRARNDIQTDTKLAHLWAPILQNMGPSLIVEADKALTYSQELVETWLKNRMLAGKRNERKAEKVATYFNAKKIRLGSIHVHGQRIGIQKLRSLGMEPEALEKNQNLQDAVLTAYHSMTVLFEASPFLKFVASNNGKKWIKKQPTP